MLSITEQQLRASCGVSKIIPSGEWDNENQENENFSQEKSSPYGTDFQMKAQRSGANFMNSTHWLRIYTLRLSIGKWLK